ncbi:MAG: MFS transporter [Cyanobacteria bacterium P01_A01_bin.84]
MKTLKIIAIYFSGFLIGVALVTFPAAGGILVDSEFHNLSSAQYGTIYIPQIAFAILSSLTAPRLSRKIGMKYILVLGMGSLIFSMFFFTLSNWFFNSMVAYYLVLWATAFIGFGFGFGITALNPFAYQLFPGKETSAVTAMHIMLGLGTASSALLITFFAGYGLWWAAPMVVGVLSIFLLFLILSVPLKIEFQTVSSKKVKNKIPRRIWFFVFGVFLYGACEATFGNFGTVFLEKERRLPPNIAALGLSLFWGAIAVGRLLFTFLALRFKTNYLFILAPFLVGAVFLFVPFAQSQAQLLFAMTLGGVGLSFLFPKSISYVTSEYPEHAALISGAMVAAIQVGTGLSSNLIGSLNMVYGLDSLFRFSSIYACIFGMLLLVLIKFKK